MGPMSETLHYFAESSKQPCRLGIHTFPFSDEKTEVWWGWAISLKSHHRQVWRGEVDFTFRSVWLLVFTAVLISEYYRPHFTDGETETPKDNWLKVTKLLSVATSGFQFTSFWPQTRHRKGLVLRQEAVANTLIWAPAPPLWLLSWGTVRRHSCGCRKLLTLVTTGWPIRGPVASLSPGSLLAKGNFRPYPRPVKSKSVL